MKISQIQFKHIFSISVSNASEFTKLQTWLNENMISQWASTTPSSSGVACYSSPKVKYCGETLYPPSCIQLFADKLFLFEDDKDAALFKLTWMGEDDNS